jgi:hypothetical protein
MRSKALAVLVAGLCLCLGLVAAALAKGADTSPPPGNDPTPTVFDVTPTTAQISAVVKPRGDVGAYHLEWGTDDAFGSSSDPIALGIAGGPQTVTGTLVGLMPATTYKVRVVVTGAGPPVVSSGVGFTTAPDAQGRPPAPDTGQGAQLQPAQTVETTPPDPSDAQQGEAVVVAPESGEVTVKQAGTNEYATLQAGTPVPVGSTVNASQGTVRLISQTADQSTQDVVLRGAKFEVRQSKDGSGITEFVLRGGNFSTCGRASTAATHKRKPRRSLWARDRGGKFRTRGLNSVATVRGTTWRVTDTCSGTTTTVSDGAVDVRELTTGRTFVVRRGQRHVARAH